VIVEKLTALGTDPLGNNPAEFLAMIRADIELWVMRSRWPAFSPMNVQGGAHLRTTRRRDAAAPAQLAFDRAQGAGQRHYHLSIGAGAVLPVDALVLRLRDFSGASRIDWTEIAII
jgi:hypothetical protein